MKRLIMALCCIVAVGSVDSVSVLADSAPPSSYTVTLPVAQMDVVLGALSKQPYGEVAQVINGLVDQIKREQSPSPVSAPTAPPPISTPSDANKTK